MKYIIYVTFSLFLLCSSCSIKVVEATTTHKQVMDKYKSKDQIVAKFGLPTSKKTEGEYEEWLYDYGTKTITDAAAVGNGYSGTRSGASIIGAAVSGRTAAGNPAVVGGATGIGLSNTATSSSAKSRMVTQDYKTFIKFTMKDNSVVTWESNGVDYGTYERVSKKWSELKK